jgi:N-acetylglucosaminyldiphosphoundecaprenol N-acetyl-beta-D-mannosaminyltransferase
MPLVTRGFFIGVGGTFDYINTVMPLPPRWIEKANLEWLWRLFVDPKRVVRISNALFGFSKLAISTKTEQFE